MTKQKDIRNGMAQLIFDWEMCVEEDAADNDGLSDKILAYLKSKGVVIKVGRELPKEEDYDYCGDEAFDDGQRSMVEAGYVAVEPLI